MKPKAIQRDISVSRARQPVVATKLGKVTRLRENDPTRKAPESGRKRGLGMLSSGPYGAPRTVSLAWSILIGLVAVGVMALAITFWILPKIYGDSYGKTNRKVADDSRIRVVSRFESPSEKETLSLVKRAVANRDPALVETYFHLNGAAPGEVVEFFKALEGKEGAPSDYQWLSSLDADGMLIEGVLVSSTLEGKKFERLALLTPNDAGVWKLDFDAYARKCTPGWKDLLAEGAVRGVVRVLLGPDSYYNGVYQNEREWDCYAIGTPDVDMTLHFYCRSGSAAAEIVKKMFRDSLNPVRATLEVVRPEGGDPRQFEITSVVAQDWATRQMPAR